MSGLPTCKNGCRGNDEDRVHGQGDGHEAPYCLAFSCADVCYADAQTEKIVEQWTAKARSECHDRMVVLRHRHIDNIVVDAVADGKDCETQNGLRQAEDGAEGLETTSSAMVESQNTPKAKPRRLRIGVQVGCFRAFVQT